MDRVTANDRRERLVYMMDAYVVGAVPPYSNILGGKLITSLIGSRKVSEDFFSRYGQSKGIISKKVKSPQLGVVTVTSALGRSSIYNRLHLRAAPDPYNINSRTLVELNHIGSTQGYGHFHLDGELFERLRRLLVLEYHKYSSGHKFGDGPNWRIRVARVGLARIGLNPGIVKHGISREVYAMPLAQNFSEVLRGETTNIIIDRPTAEISEAALQRWILRRAQERPEFNDIRKKVYLKSILEMV